MSALSIRRVGSLSLVLLFGALSFWLLIFFHTAGTKALAAVCGGFFLAAAAYILGNIRLMCLWGLGLTLPFDVSKRIGLFIEKMGGENSFRVELSDVFLVPLALFLIYDIIKGKRPGIRIPKVTWYWIALMGMGTYTVAFGFYGLTAAHEVVRMGKVLLLFLVVANELETPGRFLHCSTGLTLGLMVQSGVGVVQFINKKHLGLEVLGETGAGTIEQLAAESIRTEKAFRAGAFMNHPNIFGAFLAALLPLTVGLFLLRAGKVDRPFYLLASAVGLAALIATMSRSGWLSFAVSLTVMATLLILNERTRGRSLLAGLVVTAALGVVCIVFFDRITTRILESKASAMLSRYEYIDTATAMIKRRPLFGWGLNSYVWAAPPFTKYGPRGVRERYKQWLPPVHNIYYLWFAEMGLVGFILHILMWGGVFWIALRNMKVPDHVLFTINAACLSGLTAMAVDGVFSFTWRINSIMRLWWVFAGMVMAIHYWRLTRSAPEEIHDGRQSR